MLAASLFLDLLNTVVRAGASTYDGNHPEGGCVLLHVVSGEQKTTLPLTRTSMPPASVIRLMSKILDVTKGWHFLSHKGNWPRWS